MDVARIRQETPGCEHAIHLNAAGSALPARPVLDTMIGHLELEARVGGYEAADAVAEELEAGYGVLAELVGADPAEIAFADSATRAWDLAFHSLPFQPGDRVLTTTSEYSSNALAFIQAARRYGATVEVIPDDADGTVDLDALAAALRRGGARLVAVNHVPTHDGMVNPAAEIGALARAHGALFLLDACQSAGQLPLDVAGLQCDLLSATGRKFLRGPRGTGFLYARREVLGRLDPVMVDLRGADWTEPVGYELRPDARRFESWERSVAGQLALVAAVRYALDLGLPAIETRITTLAARLRAGLAELPGVTVTDRGARKSGLVTFTHEALPAGAVVAALAERGVVARVSEQTFRYDAGPAPRPRVRASVHCYNTEDELDSALEAVRAVVAG